jgi:hypothetical protein
MSIKAWQAIERDIKSFMDSNGVSGRAQIHARLSSLGHKKTTIDRTLDALIIRGILKRDELSGNRVNYSFGENYDKFHP